MNHIWLVKCAVSPEFAQFTAAVPVTCGNKNTMTNEFIAFPYRGFSTKQLEIEVPDNVMCFCCRRCLLNILSTFYTPEVLLDPKYKFSSSGLYYCPTKASYEDYVEFIKVMILQH